MEPRLNHLQEYLAEEFVEEYNEGRMTRRQLFARILGITGGVASAATLLLTLGCAPENAAAPTQAAPPTTAPRPTTAPSGSPSAGTSAGAAAPAPTQAPPRSKYSVKADDPAIKGADITFQGQNATLMGYLVLPTTSGPFPAVMVCHENRGLTEHIRDVTRRLAKAGFAALAVDLLSRDGGTARVDPAQAPGKLSANPAQNVSDFQSAFNYLQTNNSVQKGNIGMVGFCFGGGITWMVAEAIPQLKAAVPYYGPNPPLGDVPKIGAAVLAFYGEADQRITAGSKEIEDAMKQNGKTFEKVIYPGAGHAFNNDTQSSWNEQASDDAWEKALAWFKKYLT